jgi:hypothetical protein
VVLYSLAKPVQLIRDCFLRIVERLMSDEIAFFLGLHRTPL